MSDSFSSPSGPKPEPENQINPNAEGTSSDQRSLAEKFWNRIVHLGLGEISLRVGTGVISVLLVISVVWVMSKFYLKNQAKATTEEPAQAAVTQKAPVLPLTAELKPVLYSSFGISRQALLHTNLPAKPRTEVIEYEIVAGDTLFGIAEKFGLLPETLLWSNTHILGNDPHNIFPGVKILIPPIDGAIYKWNAGDGLNGVSKFFNVTPDAIINWPANQLDRNTLGDLSLPNIPDGKLVFVPNGKGEFTDWLPDFTRLTPAQAQILGPGFCGTMTDGPIGVGTFIWPTTETYLSGFDYSPATNHFGIDIAGRLGNPIYAVDNGVVVYSGWNTNGYGNLIVIDHGNGWQSVYAHLDTMASACGAFVFQGDIIGALGTTGNSSGPHLHFELRNTNYGKVNPWDFLQR
jgi:murein DD-endopeptidase MepM/ murein hydrolase activator NlpD